MTYDVDAEGLYIPSTDPDASRPSRALLSAMVTMSGVEGIMFGHNNGG